MKVFTIVCDYSDQKRHYNEYRNYFLDEVEAYKYALKLANECEFGTVRVIEKDFSTEKSKEE